MDISDFLSLGGGDSGDTPAFSFPLSDAVENSNPIIEALSNGGGDAVLPGTAPDQGQNEWMKLVAQNAQDAASPNGDGLTGIQWIDHLLSKVGGGIAKDWEKDPLGVIGRGVGILQAIHNMRSDGRSPNTSMMAGMVRQAQSNPTYAANPITPMAAPAAPSAASMIAIPQVQPKYVGPLTQTHYQRK